MKELGQIYIVADEYEDKDVKIYSIINTAEYSGDMGDIIVECNNTTELENYGFGDDDIEDIDKLKVGEIWVSKDYGVGCVVVRLK